MSADGFVHAASSVDPAKTLCGQSVADLSPHGGTGEADDDEACVVCRDLVENGYGVPWGTRKIRP